MRAGAGGSPAADPEASVTEGWSTSSRGRLVGAVQDWLACAAVLYLSNPPVRLLAHLVQHSNGRLLQPSVMGAGSGGTGGASWVHSLWEIADKRAATVTSTVHGYASYGLFSIASSSSVSSTGGSVLYVGLAGMWVRKSYLYTSFCGLLTMHFVLSYAMGALLASWSAVMGWLHGNRSVAAPAVPYRVKFRQHQALLQQQQQQHVLSHLHSLLAASSPSSLLSLLMAIVQLYIFVYPLEQQCAAQWHHATAPLQHATHVMGAVTAWAAAVVERLVGLSGLAPDFVCFCGLAGVVAGAVAVTLRWVSACCIRGGGLVGGRDALPSGVGAAGVTYRVPVALVAALTMLAANVYIHAENFAAENCSGTGVGVLCRAAAGVLPGAVLGVPTAPLLYFGSTAITLGRVELSGDAGAGAGAWEGVVGDEVGGGHGGMGGGVGAWGTVGGSVLEELRRIASFPLMGRWAGDAAGEGEEEGALHTQVALPQLMLVMVLCSVLSLVPLRCFGRGNIRQAVDVSTVVGYAVGAVVFEVLLRARQLALWHAA